MLADLIAPDVMYLGAAKASDRTDPKKGLQLQRRARSAIPTTTTTW